MAISPPGDIVLDVTRAADPAAAADARAKLQKIAAGASAVGFDAPMLPPQRADPKQAARAAPPKAYVKFEGMVLQTFLQSMMPNDAGSVYGDGMSGDMWKSLLAQTLGETMARRGGIGIAERVLGDHYVDDGKKVPLRGMGSADQAERIETRNFMSASLVQQFQREALDAASGSGQSPADKS